MPKTALFSLIRQYCTECLQYNAFECRLLPVCPSPLLCSRSHLTGMKRGVYCCSLPLSDRSYLHLIWTTIIHLCFFCSFVAFWVAGGTARHCLGTARLPGFDVFQERAMWLEGSALVLASSIFIGWDLAAWQFDSTACLNFCSFSV